MRTPIVHDFAACIDDSKTNAEAYHKQFYRESSYTGPSIYFHRKALEFINSEDKNRYFEYIYATLTAWGMHRMDGGAIMVPFDVFRLSMANIQESVEGASVMRLENKDAINYELIETIFKGINVMEGTRKLVGHSKVMAHLLPHLIPPVDGKRVLAYLGVKDWEYEDMNSGWEIIKSLMQEFYTVIAVDKQIQDLSRKWMCDQNKYNWDTSLPKIIDNLILGAKPSRNLPTPSL